MKARPHRHFFFVAVAIFVLLAAGISAAAQRPTMVQLRTWAKDLVLKQAEMGWKTWVLGEPSDQASLYPEFPDLFTKDSIKITEAELKKAPAGDKKKALEFFLVYQQMEYIGRQTALLNDISSDLESNEVVLVDGKLIPYHDLRGKITNEPNPSKRELLAKEEYRIFDLQNNVILWRIVSESHRLAKELGYKNYLELSQAARFVNMDELAAVCEKALDLTEPLYLKLFDEVSPIPRANFHRSDISRVLGAKEFDSVYPKENLIPALKTFLGGMGMVMDEQKNILIHDDPLPKKNPRAVCFPIVVPADVRLSIKPHGGLDDYSALFHETGHAEHFANAKTDGWEFQQLGSNAVTETYAFLFEAVPEDPAFLKEVLHADDAAAKALVKHAVFSDLYMMRRYSAKVLYERDLNRDAPDPQKLYQKYLSRAYGFQLTDDESKRYLSDVDAFMYSADYLQAFYLQSMLTQKLTKEFGSPWWKNPKAMEFLKDLWAYGNKLTGMELAEKLGYKTYSPELLLNGWEERLK